MGFQQNLSLRIQGAMLLSALVLQYALGMYVNLFVEFPQDASVGQLWEFSWRQPALAAHIILGILLFIGAIIFWIRAARFHSTTWKAPATLGFVGILAAGASGAAFVPSQTNLFSYLMSLSFLLAFFAYSWGLFRPNKGI